MTPKVASRVCRNFAFVSALCGCAVASGLDQYSAGGLSDGGTFEDVDLRDTGLVVDSAASSSDAHGSSSGEDAPAAGGSSGGEASTRGDESVSDDGANDSSSGRIDAATESGVDASAGSGGCGPVTVDGKLDEPAWTLSASATKVVMGTSNNVVHFGALRDGTYLYVGVQVLDSDIFPSTTASLWNGDAVEVFLNPSDQKAGAYQAQDRQFIVGGTNAIWEINGNTAGVLHAWATITGGYSVELGIPLANLGLTAMAGTTIGFDLANDDDDTGQGRTGQLVWAGNANDYQSTSVFGDVSFAANGCVGNPR